MTGLQRMGWTLALSGRQEYEKGWQKMEAIEAILTRRSTRRYSGEIPERALVEKVIEAGRYADMFEHIIKDTFWLLQTASLSGLWELFIYLVP